MKYFFLMLMLAMQSTFASTNIDSNLFKDLEQMDALLFERDFYRR
ncbi:hypothetical protein [Arenicella xantha]|uniref:Uncharacterized protein n=1 Tax=Arenicella xantha TaxID=644221 RepID=A0A395JKH4_9GAMM|nr:hypothetical protein [Arenicella xantha]RBP51059.1 hypothetical protein DFR28_102478 [Arenicella xantha]